MKATVTGIKYLNFEGNDGRKIQGATIFVTHEPESPETEGLEARKIFVTDNRLPAGLVPGEIIDIEYNSRGKVRSISLE